MAQSKLGEVRGSYETADVIYNGDIEAGDFLTINGHTGVIPKVIKQTNTAKIIYAVAMFKGSSGDRQPACKKGKIVVKYGITTTGKFGQPARALNNKVVEDGASGAGNNVGFIWTSEVVDGGTAILDFCPVPNGEV